MDEAKVLMKELSEKYSDYEHYPNLKGYYTTTKSFFDFCQNPTGNFEQYKNTLNDYRNEARDYISDLDYIFENKPAGSAPAPWQRPHRIFRCGLMLL